MQTKQDLEDWYKTPDPWGLILSADDHKRKEYIYTIIGMLTHPKRILDIGAGEGFISNDMSLSANLEQIEISDNAAKFLKNRVKKPTGGYDLILATGILYEQYRYEQMIKWIEKHASDIILTCHYDKAGKAHDKLAYEQIFYAEFPYRSGVQKLRVYQV